MSHGLALGLRLVAAVLSLLVLIGSGVAWATYRGFKAQITRVSAIDSSTQPRTDIDGKDQNILITGNDDRSDLNAAELTVLHTGEDGGSANTDTMMILHIPANGSMVTGISLPRDSYVSIPGHGMNRLNAAYPDGVADDNGNKSGGAKLLVQTVENLTGLTIDHYAQINLIGFYRISNAIGGVQICLNAAQKDSFSGIDLPKGISTIKGTQALAFVRQRHGLPLGDLDRIRRQQYFLTAVFRKVESAGTLLNPIKLENLLKAVSSSLVVDGDSPGHTGLDPLKLAQQMQNLTSGNLKFLTIPTTGATIDGMDVLTINAEQLPVFIQSVLGKTVQTAYQKAKTVAPATVAVSILNGTGTAGLATTTSKTLAKAGFKTSVGDATDSASTTTIQYPQGMESQAKTLAQYAPGATVAVSTNVSKVTLILGSDNVAVHTQPASATSSGTSKLVGGLIEPADALAGPVAAFAGTATTNVPATTATSPLGCIN
jgi:LCP family protein required for cell wall assembly